MRAAALTLGGLMVCLAGLGGSAVAGWGIVFLVFLLLTSLAELVLSRPNDLAARLLQRLHLDAPFRSSLRLALATLLVALSPVRIGHRLEGALVILLGGAVILQGARLLVEQLTRWTNRSAAPPIDWVNLEVVGVPKPIQARYRVGGQALGVTLSFADVPLAITAALVAAGTDRDLLWAGGGISVAVAAVSVWVALTRALAVRGNPDELLVRDRVAAALAELAPTALLYMSRPEPSSYIMTVWLPTLATLHERGDCSVVIVRERQHLAAAAGWPVPAVLITRANDLDAVVPPSVKVALYPSNVAKNNHLIRTPGIKDVFIGHGDSDKGGSATTLSRIYDEVWVSGPAGRDRYHRGEVGVRDDQIREIGRPQLAAVRRSQPAGSIEPAQEHLGTAGAPRWTVLYAPTREGFYADWNYSSVVSMGTAIVTSLLALPDVRLILKTHPGTGTDDPSFALAAEELQRLVADAGAPHRVALDDEELFDIFNESDMLVSDISSVISDFLASGKPYVVTNPSGLEPDTFRQIFPSAGGAAILGPDVSELAEQIDDARHAHAMGERRREVAAYLLGTSDQDPVQRFADAIARLATEQDEETLRLSGVPTGDEPSPVSP